MKKIDKEIIEEMIKSLLKRPEMFAHDCISLSEQFHMLYGLWSHCMELPDNHVRNVYTSLSLKHQHGNLFMGSKFTNMKELASVFGDVLFEQHKFEI